jgi:hypothetical protein
MHPVNVGLKAWSEILLAAARYALVRYSILSLKVLVNTSLPLLNMPKVAS